MLYIFKATFEQNICSIVRNPDKSILEFQDSFEAINYVAKRVAVTPETYFFVLNMITPENTLTARFCLDAAIYSAFRRTEESEQNA